MHYYILCSGCGESKLVSWPETMCRECQEKGLVPKYQQVIQEVGPESQKEGVGKDPPAQEKPHGDPLAREVDALKDPLRPPCWTEEPTKDPLFSPNHAIHIRRLETMVAMQKQRIIELENELAIERHLSGVERSVADLWREAAQELLKRKH